MQQSNQPPKYVIPFAQNDASKATIPPTSADDTRASQSQGFPPRTGLPPEAGGVPPQKADMNGALNQLAGPILWGLAGGRFPFDNAFASDSNIGGYPLGANLPAADGRGEWYSTTNDNLASPDTVGTGWVPGYHYGTTALTGQTGGTVTLTPAQAAKRVITVAGTLTGNLVLVVPGWQYNWTIYNNTSGAFSVSVRTASGSAAAIPQNGAPTPVNCDGTNCSLTAPNIGPATSGTQALRADQAVGRSVRSTASGTWVVPDGVTSVMVSAVAAGGGGGGSGAGATSSGAAVGGGGGGGGAGQALIGMTYSVTPGSTVNWSIGSPGSGAPAVGLNSGSPGTDAGNLTISGAGFNGGVVVTLTGGGGGGGGVASATLAPGALGGSGAPVGGYGQDALATGPSFGTGGAGGTGASSAFGGGGYGGRGASGSGVPGGNAGGFGAGGGGGGGPYTQGVGAGGAGGNGSPGLIILQW